MSDELIRALVLITLFGAVMLLADLAIGFVRGKRAGARAINERLRLIGRGLTRDQVLSAFRRRGTDTRRLAGPLGSLQRHLELRLDQAAIRTSSSHATMILTFVVLVIFFLSAVMTASAGYSLGFGRVLMLLAFSSGIGLGIPLAVIKRRANSRQKKLAQQFPVALDVFVRGLRSGHPVASALDLLATEMSDPIGSEFGIVVDEVGYGADVKDALQNMANRCGLADMQMFVVCLSVQSETGGNLAEVLENLADVIRDRASMMMKVRALSSEGRMTGVMLSILPVFAFVMLFITNPAFYLDVADDPAFVPSFGGLILAFVIGVFWIRKLVDLKV